MGAERPCTAKREASAEAPRPNPTKRTATKSSKTPLRTHCLTAPAEPARRPVALAPVVIGQRRRVGVGLPGVVVGEGGVARPMRGILLQRGQEPLRRLVLLTDDHAESARLVKPVGVVRLHIDGADGGFQGAVGLAQLREAAGMFLRLPVPAQPPQHLSELVVDAQRFRSPGLGGAEPADRLFVAPRLRLDRPQQQGRRGVVRVAVEHALGLRPGRRQVALCVGAAGQAQLGLRVARVVFQAARQIRLGLDVVAAVGNGDQPHFKQGPGVIRPQFQDPQVTLPRPVVILEPIQQVGLPQSRRPVVRVALLPEVQPKPGPVPVAGRQVAAVERLEHRPVRAGVLRQVCQLIAGPLAHRVPLEPGQEFFPAHGLRIPAPPLRLGQFLFRLAKLSVAAQRLGQQKPFPGVGRRGSHAGAGDPRPRQGPDVPGLSRPAPGGAPPPHRGGRGRRPDPPAPRATPARGGQNGRRGAGAGRGPSPDAFP